MSEQPGLLRVEPTVVTPKMNKTEAAYAQYLECRRLADLIYAWWFQPERFWLGEGALYTPDFRVWYNDGTVEFIEIKGSFLREAARVRFIVVQGLHPMYRWRMVTREGSLKKGDGRWVDWADRKRRKKGGV